MSSTAARLWFGAVAVLLGCEATAPTDLAGLAEQPPLAYSVLLTGGSFVVEPDDVDVEAPLGRTFGGAEGAPDEAITLQEITADLRRARVFTRIEPDELSDPAFRRRIAEARGNLDLQDDAVRRLLERTRLAGHDYLLVVQRLQDGEVEEYGINDRWPVTTLLWLLIGLGMLIPDHTYESRASLDVALYEIHTGRQVYRTRESGGPVELALVSRGSTWGIVSSIIIPPFWVSSDDQRVVSQVRVSAARRLLFSLARRLKSVACQQELSEEAPASLTLQPAPGGILVRIRSARGLSFVRMRLDGRGIDGPDFELFERQLLESAGGAEGSLSYSARMPGPLPGRFLQVLLQTVAGGTFSSTIDLEDL